MDSEKADMLTALDGLTQHLNAAEQAFVAMHREGIRDTEAYFKVLKDADPSLADAPKETRQRLVKNFWDRLLKKLQRRAKG